MEHLQAIIATLNATMEHVPAQTRAILSEVVRPHVEALDKALQPKKEG